MIAYFDTSALIKLVFDEPGSELAAELWDRADSAVSGQLVYPEARAALAAALRGRRFDAIVHRDAVAAVDHIYGELHIIALDEELARQAGDLAQTHGLRGYDAVHLACALNAGSGDTLLATWDHALDGAAVATGRLLTINRS